MAQEEMFPVPPTSPASIAQCMSALVKMIRLRREEEAVYWFAHIMTLFPPGAVKFRATRRILIGAAEDGLNPVVQSMVSDWYKKVWSAKDVMSCVRGAAMCIHAICKYPNWWGCETGQRFIAQGRNAELAYRDMLVFERTDRSVQNFKGMVADEAWLAYWCKKELWYADGAPAGGAYRLALEVHDFVRAQGDQLARMVTLVHLKNAKALSSDDNFLVQAMYRVLYEQLDVSEEPVLDVEKVRENVQSALKRLQTPEKPPPYTQDGIHSSGKDRRYAGLWKHMLASCRAFREHGRLHQDDHHPATYHSKELGDIIPTRAHLFAPPAPAQEPTGPLLSDPNDTSVPF